MLQRGRVRGLVYLGVCGLVYAGLACSRAPGPAGPTSTGSAASGAGSGGVEHLLGEARGAKSLAGRWKLAYTDRGMDVDVALVEIRVNEADPQRGSAELVSLSPLFGAATLKKSEVAAPQVRLEFDSERAPFVFEGEWQAGRIGGVFSVPRIVQFPARLSATDKASLEGATEPQPLPEQKDFQKALQGGDPVAALHDFIKHHPGSPLTLDAYGLLSVWLKRERFQAKDVEQFVADYRQATGPWGARLAHKVALDVGVHLARENHLPELAVKYLLEFRSHLQDDTPDDWRVQLAEGLVEVDRVEEGLEIIRGLHEQYPQDTMTSYVFARALEKHGDLDAARALFAELAVMPQQELMIRQSRPESSPALPSEAVARLWKQKHGTTDGLEAYLAEVYRTKINSTLPKRDKPWPERADRRVSLIELMTGATCPPCVAADVACEALAQHYAPTETIVLKYHLHVPGPDPLASAMTEQRAAYYQLAGTPMAWFNGQSTQELRGGRGIGGFYPDSRSVAEALRERVEAGADQTARFRLQLSGAWQDGKLAVTAAAQPIGEQALTPDLRLRICLVEDRLEFRAPNGIREHDGIVRAMLGGVEGTPPGDGQLKFEGKVDLAEVRKQLEKDLDTAERVLGTDFVVRPMGLVHLALVAFVQDDKSREVLQAVRAEISGTRPAEAAGPGPAQR